LILTDAPRIFYIDTRRMEFKGEVPWDSQLRVEVKNDTLWKIIIPKRAYDLEDVQRDAYRWKTAIEKYQEDHDKQDQNENNT